MTMVYVQAYGSEDYSPEESARHAMAVLRNAIGGEKYLSPAVLTPTFDVAVESSLQLSLAAK